MTAEAARPLLQVEGLRIEGAYRPVADSKTGGTRAAPPLLEDLTFDIAPGEFVALVGESGSGKTLAARAVLGLLPAGVRRTGGAIRLEGRALTELSPAELRAIRGREVGMVFQEPMTSLNPALTIGRQLAEGLALHARLSAAEIRARCLEMLRRVGIEPAEQALSDYPHVFSGGMRQRIMLASVLLLRPKLLIADEPTTALDTLSQREVMELTVELARDAGTAVLLITHDLGLVAQYAQRVVVLAKGVTVETGDAGKVLREPAHPYTRRLVAALPRRAPPRAVAAREGVPLLQVQGACIDYPGRPTLFGPGPPHRVVKGVDLVLHAGEIAAVVGASGSGKTTLGRAVMGLKSLAAGTIALDGVSLAAMNTAQRRAFRRDVQLVFQDPFSSLDPSLRVGEIVGAALRHLDGADAATRSARVQAILEEVGLAGFAGRLPHQMSGGQRQRVAIARAVVSRPRLVVADEPVSALDMTIQRQVLDLFGRLQAQYGFASLFITHDLGVVEQVADRVYVMSDGAVVEEGATAEVFDAPSHPYTRALLAASPSRLAASLTHP